MVLLSFPSVLRRVIVIVLFGLLLLFNKLLIYFQVLVLEFELSLMFLEWYVFSAYLIICLNLLLNLLNKGFFSTAVFARYFLYNFVLVLTDLNKPGDIQGLFKQ